MTDKASNPARKIASDVEVPLAPSTEPSQWAHSAPPVVAAGEALVRSALAGGMTDEQRVALEERLHKALNVPEDAHNRPQLAVPLGRHPDADVSMLEDDSELPAAQRVGTRSVEHPRARMASAMHEWLGGLSASDYSIEALSSAAEKFGMQVDGTGVDGAVTKTDLVRAMDALAAQFPKRGNVTESAT